MPLPAEEREYFTVRSGTWPIDIPLTILCNFVESCESFNDSRSCAKVAKAIKRPTSVRAVANAIAKNPYSPKIPCHRVIRSDGSLGGYSGKGGKKMKKILLKHEGYIT